MAQSKAAVVINYTENELAAIEVLKANAGNKLSAKELGIPTAILTSLMRKAVDEKGLNITVFLILTRALHSAL